MGDRSIIVGGTSFLIYVVQDDHVTPKTGLVTGDFTVKQRSIDAAAFGAFATFTITERAYGWYKVTCDAADTTPANICGGIIAVHLEATGCDPVDIAFNVNRLGQDTYNAWVQSSDIATTVWSALEEDYDVEGSFGKHLKHGLVRQGTAQAGAAYSITLDAGASATNDLYLYLGVRIVSGTGAGQFRQVSSYNGATKVAAIAIAWATNPDATSVFQLVTMGTSESAGLAYSYASYYIPIITAALITRGAAAAFTCQAGSTDTTIVLDAAASATADFYNGQVVVLTAGTGAGQARVITDYVGTGSNTATVDSAWAVTPDNTTQFKIVAFNAGAANIATAVDVAGAIASANIPDSLLNTALIDYQSPGTLGGTVGALQSHGATATAGASGSITLAAGASATNSLYNGQVVVIVNGTGAGQARMIASYTGTTKVATVDTPWAVNPDATSEYRILTTTPVGDDAMTRYAQSAAVWNAAIDDLGLDPNTYGEALRVGVALSNSMYMVDNTTHTVNGMTAARLRVFDSAAALAAATDGGTGEGEIAVIDVTCSFDGAGKINVYKAKRVS